MANKTKTRRMTKKQIEQQRQFRLEIGCAFFFIVLLLTVLGEFGWTMQVGDILVTAFKFLFGIGRYLVYPYGIYCIFRTFIDKQLPTFSSKSIGTLLVFLALSIFFCLPGYHNMNEQSVIMATYFDEFSMSSGNIMSGGGILGIFIYSFLRAYTGIPGTIAIGAFCFLIGMALCLQKTLQEMIGEPIKSTTESIAESYESLQQRRKQVFDVDRFYDDDADVEDAYFEDEIKESPATQSDDSPSIDMDPAYTDYYADFDVAIQDEPLDMLYDYTDKDIEALDTTQELQFFPEEGNYLEEKLSLTETARSYGEDSMLNDLSDAKFDVEENTHITTGEVIEKVRDSLQKQNKNYQLPQLSLLDRMIGNNQANNNNTQREQLQMALDSYGVNAQVSDVHVGPAVTQYEITLAPGVKVNRIVNLQTDLALALAAKGVRIEAPIPGKPAVGIEVPNETVQMVGLYDVLRPVHKDKSKKLLAGLGKKISGDALQIELNKMPHLLVAGSTGSGKSVCINSIIVSILLRATPDEVKFVMVDPKKVELNVYNDIPHLLSPVVTDAKKAAVTLHKVVKIMEERYELFADAFVRNMEGYNEYAKQNGLEEMPYIVVIIDELADLMVVAAKEVEEAIMRLAQMARAAGIHMIVATQRPSVDVITGVIKSNIPSRIAFAVSSQVDSRTILDMSGAERLVGKGDMLYLASGENKPIRVQGTYVSEIEIEKIVSFVKEQQAPEFNEEIVTATSSEAVEELFADSENEVDELFEEAVSFAISVEMISASKLQRRFRLGYNRAARIIDEMVDRNLLGPSAGNKGRPVLIKDISEMHGKQDVYAEDIYGTEALSEEE